jgi:hypothetical protein
LSTSAEEWAVSVRPAHPALVSEAELVAAQQADGPFEAVACG